MNEILLGIDETPNDSWLGRLHLKQIKKSDQRKDFLALRHQDIVPNGKPKSYQRLKSMVEVHLEEKTKEFHSKMWLILPILGGYQGGKTFMETGNYPFLPIFTQPHLTITFQIVFLTP